jgi:hypothetical protein
VGYNKTQYKREILQIRPGKPELSFLEVLALFSDLTLKKWKGNSR